MDPNSFAVRYGYLLLFSGTLIEQLGFPPLSAPLLLAAGALIRAGSANMLVAICLSGLASSLAHRAG